MASTHGIQVGSTAGTSINPFGGTLTYNGIITDLSGNTGVLTKQGAGTLSLGGVSTYTGATSINKGTIQLTTGNDRLPIGTVLSLGEAASTNLGTLDLNGRNQTIGGLNSTSGTNATASNNIITSSSAATLTVSGSGTYGDGTNANSGIITGAISLVKSGSGTLTLGDANTYTGTTTVSGGTLQLAGGNAGSVGAITSSPIGTSTLNLNGGTLSSNSTTARTVLNATSIGGNITLGDATNTGAITFDAATTISGATPTLTAASAVTFTGAIGDGGNAFGITKAGDGTLTLSGANTYTGATTINAGTLALSGSGSIATSSTITVGSGATFDISGRTAALTLAAGQSLRSSATGSNTTATVTVAATPTLTLSAGGLAFTAYDGGATAPMTVAGTGGSLALASSPVTVTTTTALAVGTYKLIAKSGSATVTGTPGTLTMAGSGLAASTTGALSVVLGELVLTVTSSALTVTYDSQSGSAISSGSTTTGGSIASSPGTPTRAGYTFNGWFAAASGGTAISFPYTHGQTANFTLYAQWTANTLTVTYDLQGGTGISNGSTTTGGTIANPGTPTQSGFSFNGWFAAASGGTAISFPYAHGQTANFTLYAQWTASAVCSAPTVANTSVPSVGATVATLSAEVTGLGNTATAITARGVEYATNSALTTPATSSQTGTFAVETFSRSLTALNANTQYWYRGFATNDCGSPLTGYSHTSSFPTFTTQHNAPTVGAETVVTSGGFTANWTVNNANSAGGAVFTYQLEYSTTSDFSSGVTAITGISSGNTSQAVTGLNPATNYWYRVRVNNAGGNSNYSGVEALTTLNNPTVTLSVDVSSGTEAGATVITATATASAAVIGNQSVTIAASGTNITAGDYAFSSTTITILSGATTGTRTFTIVNDAVVEGTETATLTISSPTSGITLGATTTQNITIMDNDFSTVNLTVSASTGTEAAGTVITATATLSAAAPTDQTVNVALSGTGLTPTDFTGIDFSTTQTITILNGATTGTRTFAVANDATYECVETATFTISAPTSGIVLGATTTATHAITDNDFPTVNLSINTASGSEAATTSITLTATASAAVIGAQTVSVALTGTGLANADFTGATFPAAITIANGATTGTVTFTIVDDSSVEGDESATFTISSPSSCVALGATTTQGLTIVENDFPAAPCSELFISEYVEGSSNNKYIEIYNPTSSSVNLSTYSLRLYSNGATATTQDVALSGSLAAYGTIVYQNSGEAAYTGTGVNNAAVAFNGDDAVALAKSGVNVDIFGTIGEDPGTRWTSGAFETLDKTLVRNATVEVGINANPGAGFPTLSTEWTQSNVDVVSNLGSHTCDCFVANPIVTLGINISTGSEASSPSITLTATADAAVTGDQTVQVTLSGTGVTNADFTSATFPTNITILGGATTGSITFTINNDVAVEGGETATFTIGTPSSGLTIGTTSSQNLVILDDDNLTSTESVITSVGGEAATISSLTNGTVTTSTEGTQVWQFRLYDGNGSSSDADTKPTIYEQWVIRPSAGNTVPNWSATLNNIKFFQDASGTPILGSFVVNSASISFIPTTAITVSDNGFALISLRVTIDNPLAANSDGLNFGFSLVPADVTVETDVLLSSQLGAFTPTSNGALNEIDIDATLQFISAPTTVGIGDAFTITISAIDANGNIDEDDNTLITLAQNSGTGNLTGENAANLVNGTYTWTGLTYDTEETFQVIASGGGYSAITVNINVVDADYQLFDHFNRTNNYTVGVPSSETVTTWSEVGTGDGSRTRIVGGQLVLTNCNDGSSSGGSNGMEKVLFNVENSYETIFNDANGPVEWVFNIHQDRTDPSGFGSNTYVAAVILGADQLAVDAAGADGYAVIIGSSGDPDPVKLVRFTNGLTANANVSDVAVSSQTSDENYFSVRVTFNPCNGLWSLFVRNDGALAFADPNSGSLGTAVTGTDLIHTALDLKFFGTAWQHGGSCTETAIFDNLHVPTTGAASSTGKSWNGSISANWNTAANWGPCPGVPTNTDDVIIANVATQPIVSATPAFTCKDLTVNAGADLTINSGQFLYVYGNVVNNGTANFGAGTLVMEGGATATLAGNVNVANFHVSSPVTLNGTVTVSSIARSEAGGAITANGNLVIESGAQLLHGVGTTNGGGSVSGNILVRRQGTSSSTKYNYWSTPVAGGTLPGSSGYAYNSSLGTHDFSDDVNPGDPGWQSFGGAMTNGRGYASRGGGLATFTGAANNATITYGVTTSANSMSSLSPGTRFNLSGNPYPSAISANSFISVNGPSGTGRIAGVLYFWDDDNSGGSGYASSDYAVWSGVGSVGGGGNTPNGFISTGQGFHVDAQSSGNISFTNAMRGGTNSQFFRLAEEEPMDRIWINLTGNDLFNQALVVFKDDATELRDVMYDAYKVRSNANISLGAMQANESYTIAAYPTITQARIVPLQTFVAQSGTYTFEADSIDGFEDIAVYLEDLQSGQMHLLSQGTTVTVQMTAQDEFNRFQLWFSPELVTNISQTEEQVSRILSTMNGFQVQMASDVNTIGEFKLYNAMGQIVMVQPLSVANGRSSMVDVSALPMGVYHAEFRSAEGTITAKTIK